MSPRNRAIHAWTIFFVTLLATVASADTLEFHANGGTLVVETKDPAIKVALTGDDLTLGGPGYTDIRLKTGPYLFQSADDKTRNEVLFLTKEGRVVLRVSAIKRDGASAPPEAARPQPEEPPGPPREELVRSVRDKAGEMVTLRSSLDERVWPIASRNYTTTEAAKILIAFFRGYVAPEIINSNTDVSQLQEDLQQLRDTRESAFQLLGQIARQDAKKPVTPLVGTWEVTKVAGAGGIAADALEVYDPDPVGRKFVATNDGAALLTGGAFWLFDAKYEENAAHGDADFSAVVRSGTIYHVHYSVDGDTAKLHIPVMNQPSDPAAEAEPHDGSFILTLRRTK